MNNTRMNSFALMVWVAAFMLLSKTARASDFAIDACTNNDDYEITSQDENSEEKEYRCEDFRWYTVLREELCAREDVHLNCPDSCGVCCQDDPSFVITRPNGSNENCSWLEDDEFRREEWCNTMSNGQFVRDACKKTCKVCKDYVYVTPSISPTEVASASPSLAPSLSASPSLTPSFGPSLPPSASPSSKLSSAKNPSGNPSSAPTSSQQPSSSPSAKPSPSPSKRPTLSPSKEPTKSPTSNPTSNPTTRPTDSPSDSPTLSDKPNLVIVMTDEHNLRTISAYRNYLLTKHDKEQVDVWGNDLYLYTPWLDSLARDGAMYTNFYTVAPLCTPSRASFLTGMYPQFTGSDLNHSPMNPNLQTFADLLRDERGYYTGYMGKFHLDGEAKPGWGDNGRSFGFDFNTYRYNRGHWKYFAEVNGGVKNFKDEPDFFENYNGPYKQQRHYATDYLIDRGMEFIDSAASQNKPFALMISIPDPHSPNENRPPYRTRYQSTSFKYPRTAAANMKADPAPPSWNAFSTDEFPLDEVDQYVKDYASGDFWQNQMQQYFGMVANIDFNMGKLLYSIRNAGIEDNTIIVFTSDHGDMLGEHGRENKGVPYETSAGIPFLIKYPDKIQRGKIVETPYSSVDFAPTILSLMNVKDYSRFPFHGVDGSDELLDSSQVSRREDKIIILMDTGLSPSWAAAVKDGYKLVVSLRTDPFLFDLNVDPEEMINYIDSDSPNHVAVKADLQAALGEALSKLEIPMTNIVSDVFLDRPACFDSNDAIRLRTGEMVTCNDIGQGIFTNDCGDFNVDRHCPRTCGTCKCEDSLGPIFVQGKVGTCGDFADECSSSGKVRTFCHKMCDRCN
jgi:arylsulfatase A-like enzyme